MSKVGSETGHPNGGSKYVKNGGQKCVKMGVQNRSQNGGPKQVTKMGPKQVTKWGPKQIKNGKIELCEKKVTKIAQTWVEKLSGPPTCKKVTRAKDKISGGRKK